MTEEQVTKAILKWLTDNQWEIVCFDFPQSGTGRLLHPNLSSDKNRKAINPDIVAVRDHVCVFFENKDRFYYPDYEKINNLRVNQDYSEAISALLAGYSVSNIYYGIGLPTQKHKKKSEDSVNLVDFIIGVNEDRSMIPLYLQNTSIFA